jgi:hypothetical protein
MWKMEKKIRNRNKEWGNDQERKMKKTDLTFPRHKFCVAGSSSKTWKSLVRA